MWALCSALCVAQAAPSDANTQIRSSMLLSIDEAVALALANNYDIRTATLQRIADRYALRLAHDKFRPHWGGMASAGTTWSEGPLTIQSAQSRGVSLNPHAEVLMPTGTLLTADLAQTLSRPPSVGTQPWAAAFVLGISQPLLRDFGFEVNRASVNLAELQEGINRLTLENRIITTLSTVIFAYRQFRQASMLRDIADSAVERARQLLDINHQMVAAGRIAPAELIQVESDIANREVNLVNAQSDYAQAQVALLELLALQSDTPITSAAEPISIEPTMPIEQAIHTALDHRPEYTVGLLSKELAVKNLLVAENNRRWDLQLLAQYRRGAVVNSGAQMLVAPLAGPSQSGFVGLTLTVPLVEMTLQQQVINAEVVLSQADVAMAALRTNIRGDVDAALRTLHLKHRVLELGKKARDLAELKLDNERQKLSVGRSSNFQVLRFGDDLVNAEIVEIRAGIDYLNAVTTFQAKVGVLLDRWDTKMPQGLRREQP